MCVKDLLVGWLCGGLLCWCVCVNSVVIVVMSEVIVSVYSLFVIEFVCCFR